MYFLFLPFLGPTLLLYINPITAHPPLLYNLEICPSRNTAPPPLSDASKTPNALGITGDILQVTRCYCTSPHNDRWGYFTQANYTNYHTSTTMSANYVCNDNHRSNDNVPSCWDNRLRQKEEFCADDSAENEFCYQFKNGKMVFGVQDDFWTPQDRYTFNKQTRSIGGKLPNHRLSADICQSHCDYWLDGMQMAVDAGSARGEKTLDLDWGWHPKVCSRDEVWTDLDDMCWRCKKKEE